LVGGRALGPLFGDFTGGGRTERGDEILGEDGLTELLDGVRSFFGRLRDVAESTPSGLRFFLGLSETEGGGVGSGTLEITGEGDMSLLIESVLLDARVRTSASVSSSELLSSSLPVDPPDILG
jgi:hypothetical protein